MFKCWTCIYLLNIFSRIKFMSNFICFIWACCGIRARATTLRLLHYSIGTWEWGRWSSPKRDWIQISSEVVLARLLYSAFMLEWEITCRFLYDQHIGLTPRNTQYSIVDLRSSRHEAQSASAKAVKDNELDFLSSKP